MPTEQNKPAPPAAESSQQKAQRTSLRNSRRFIARWIIISSVISLLLGGLLLGFNSQISTLLADFDSLGSIEGGPLAVSIFMLAGGCGLLLLLPVLGGERREWERIMPLIFEQRGHFSKMLMGSAIFLSAALGSVTIIADTGASGVGRSLS